MRFSDDLSLREARQRFFAATGYDEAHYDDPWVKLKLGFVPFAIPNTSSRRRAVRYHDLHHILTGYDTHWRGESEISAWELATGCRDLTAAWVINALGLLMGLVIAPRRVLRAFLRGRRSANLYGEPFTEQLLEQRVGTVRERLGL